MTSTTPYLLVAQTLAHVACVAILQDHAPTPATVFPQLRTALNSRIVVEQAKGYLREHFDVSIEDAFRMLRHHARSHGEHLTEIARCLVSDPEGRQAILTAMGNIATSDPKPFGSQRNPNSAGR